MTPRPTGPHVDDVLFAAIVQLLARGPQPFGLPRVSTLMAITGHEVGGPAHVAIDAARRRGVLRLLPWDEVQQRRLPCTGWPWCEDVR